MDANEAEWAGDVRPVEEILRAKREDRIDCSADESAAIKAYFDHYDLSETGSLAYELSLAFPNESDEWQRDVEQGLRALGKGWVTS